MPNRVYTRHSRRPFGDARCRYGPECPLSFDGELDMVGDKHPPALAGFPQVND